MTKEYAVGPVWSRKSVGVQSKTEGTSGTSDAATFAAPVNVVGTIEQLDATEIESGGYSSDEVVVKVALLATAFTLGIARGWRLSIDGNDHEVKRTKRENQFKVVVEAQRLA